jgi:hypothetical protein
MEMITCITAMLRKLFENRGIDESADSGWRICPASDAPSSHDFAETTIVQVELETLGASPMTGEQTPTLD